MLFKKIERLDLRRERRGQVAVHGGRDEADALREQVRRVGLERLGDDDDSRLGAEGWIEADLARAARDGDAQIGVVQAVARDGVADEIGPVLFGNGQLQSDQFGRPLQAGQVLLEHEDAAVVGAQRLVDAVTIEEAMVEDGNQRLFARDEPVVQENPHIRRNP